MRSRRPPDPKSAAQLQREIAYFEDVILAKSRSRDRRRRAEVSIRVRQRQLEAVQQVART